LDKRLNVASPKDASKASWKIAPRVLEALGFCWSSSLMRLKCGLFCLFLISFFSYVQADDEF
jgi:hypothetical protein